MTEARATRREIERDIKRTKRIERGFKQTIATQKWIEREADKICARLEPHIAFLTQMKPLVLDAE